MPPSAPSFARIPPLVAATLAALVLGGAPACGPSLRRVQQANQYFERCFAANRDARRSDSERRACWTAWHQHYQVGQPEDRIDYVRERLVMLDPARSSVIELATSEVQEPEPGSVEAGGIGAPGVEVPPEAATTETATTEAAMTEAARPEGPELSTSLEGRPTVRQRRRPVAPRVRTSACAAACEPDFVACANRCEIADRGCTNACRHRFRQCSRGCF